MGWLREISANLKRGKAFEKYLNGCLGSVAWTPGDFPETLVPEATPWIDDRGPKKDTKPNGAFGTEAKFFRSFGERSVILRNDAGGTEGKSFQVEFAASTNIYFVEVKFMR